MPHKYPFIPDKRMYAAVMGACSYIRETGYFNKAVSYYADKYNVDEDDLAKHIRARQSAGQRGRTSSAKGKKYKWFIVSDVYYCDAYGEEEPTNHRIERGISKDSILNRHFESDLRFSRANDYGGSYAPSRTTLCSAGYSTEQEALDALEKMKGATQ